MAPYCSGIGLASYIKTDQLFYNFFNQAMGKTAWNDSSLRHTKPAKLCLGYLLKILSMNYPIMGALLFMVCKITEDGHKQTINCSFKQKIVFLKAFLCYDFAANFFTAGWEYPY